MNGQANKAILLTAPGTAAIAVVRVAGPATGEFLHRHFAKEIGAGAGEPQPVHGNITDGGRIIDDAVVVFDSERQQADINVHGGPWIIHSLMDLLRRIGFQVIDPAPLPLPEFAVDADSWLRRDVLSYLPLARTELGLRALLAQEQAWEAMGSSPDREGQIGRMLNDRALYWLLHPPRVAIIGIPNVGKSTLANQLFAQERSITADLPGTTRDWVGEIANVDGLPVMLIDTPGLRESTDPLERQAIQGGREQIWMADLVVVVLDASQPMEEQSHLLAEWQQPIVVMNKIDQIRAEAAHYERRAEARTANGGDDRRGR